MKTKFEVKVSRFLILFGIIWTVCVLCAACGDVDTLFTTAQAVVAGIGVVLAALGAVIPAPIAAAITAALTLVKDALGALKTAYDDYKAEPASATLLGKVENGFSAVQQALNQLLSAARIENATLRAWITKVVTAVGDALKAVSADILPIVKTAVSEGHVDAARVAQISASAKEINAALKASYEISLGDLPSDVSGKAMEDFKSRTRRRHVGPIPM